MRVLVIAAHPDDEVLGCGGTIARLPDAGDEVSIAILGEGITSRADTREGADPEEVKRLQGACLKVGRFLGAKEVRTFGLPDNRFDTVPLLDIVKLIEGLVGELSPEVVYTHHGGDLNIDHSLVSRATLTATRPLAGCPVRELYAYEVPSSTEWAFEGHERAFRPNTFVDISKTLDRKVQAVRMYESEARGFPHPRSPEALRAIAARWGSAAGMAAAEAFELIRALK